MSNSNQWAPWTFKAENLTLEVHDERSRMVYQVDLERCTTSAQVLDWIVQVSGKTWANDRIIAELVHELNRRLDLQGRLCGQGIEKGPIDVRALLK